MYCAEEWLAYLKVQHLRGLGLSLAQSYHHHGTLRPRPLAVHLKKRCVRSNPYKLYINSVLYRPPIVTESKRGCGIQRMTSPTLSHANQYDPYKIHTNELEGLAMQFYKPQESVLKTGDI